MVCGRPPARQRPRLSLSRDRHRAGAAGAGEAGEVAEATLVQRVGAGVVGEGWHERASGRSPDAQTVRAQLAALLRLLEVLGLRRAGGDWRTRWVALTEPGRALALEALRARATGPRPDPRGP